MNQRRSLLHENVKNIANVSVKEDTLRAQRDELNKAEKRLARAEQRVSRYKAKVQDQKTLSSEARLRHKQKNTAQTKRACESAANKLKLAKQQYAEAVSGLRDIKQIVRDLRAVSKKLEKKEAAKQKAVAQFLKKWERDYDRKIALLEKNAEQRRRWLQSDGTAR